MPQGVPTLVFVGGILPSLALALGTFVPASDVTRAMVILAFVVSGILIGRWWAPIPSVAAWIALSLAEEANHWGFGPGTRFGTAIEIHSGGDFSLSFFAFATAVALALSTVGLAIRHVAGAPAINSAPRRQRSATVGTAASATMTLSKRSPTWATRKRPTTLSAQTLPPCSCTI